MPRARKLPALAPVALGADRPDTHAALGQRGAITADGLVAGRTWAGSLRAAVDAARTRIVFYVLERAHHAVSVAARCASRADPSAGLARVGARGGAATRAARADAACTRT
jgi:hypothetical protein